MFLGQAPPMPDGATGVEKFLYWALGSVIVIMLYFYRLLETKNGKEIEELKLKLEKCESEHEKANDQFAELRREMKEIQAQRYKQT